MNPKAPAFPTDKDYRHDAFAHLNGLTIRDYIAIEAMKSLINGLGHGEFSPNYDGICKLAYRYAAALIAESNRK